MQLSEEDESIQIAGREAHLYRRVEYVVIGGEPSDDEGAWGGSCRKGGSVCVSQSDGLTYYLLGTVGVFVIERKGE